MVLQTTPLDQLGHHAIKKRGNIVSTPAHVKRMTVHLNDPVMKCLNDRDLDGKVSSQRDQFPLLLWLSMSRICDILYLLYRINPLTFNEQ